MANDQDISGMQNSSKITGLERGKVPPQAIDMEEIVLGAMLLDTKAPDTVFGIIRTKYVFFKEAHQQIFLAAGELYAKSSPIDLMTVSQKLRERKKLDEIGGDFYLVELTRKIASSAHTEYHCRVLMQYFIKRSLIMVNNQIISLAYDDATDSLELLDRYQKEFDKVVDLTLTGRRTISFPDALDSLKQEVERLSSNEEEVPLVGVTTGFKSTDRHTGGYRKGDLVILAARPGMGKTSKVLKTVVENVKKGVPVGFISLEMSMAQLAARMVAIDTNFHLKQLLKTGFEKLEYFETYDAHCNRMKKYPFFVNDSGISDLTEIVIQAKAWKRSQGIELLVIDYLQLMDDKTVGGHNREAVISSISRRLKLLAKELEIPVIALSQLSRAVETRGGSKRPGLSDLRDSGAIEQDADIVEFIYRPEYYNAQMDENDYGPRNKKLMAMGANSEINYAKFRGGSVATVLLKWIGDKTKFIDVDDSADTVEYIDGNLPTMTPQEAFDDGKTVFDAE